MERMKPISIGDEVEVYKVGARDPWRSEVRQLHVLEGELMAIKVRVPGGQLYWFAADDGRARDGWSLAPKHVPARVA